MTVFHILEYICSCVLKDTRAVDFKPIDIMLKIKRNDNVTGENMRKRAIFIHLFKQLFFS